MNKSPTTEQKIIINENNNLVITAKPGSGKTFTIIEKINKISKDLMNFQGVIAISYTNKASLELEQRYRRKNGEKNQHFFGTIDKFYILEIIIPFCHHLFENGKNLRIIDNLSGNMKYKELLELKSDNTNINLILLLKEALKEGNLFIELCGEIALLILREVTQALIYLKAKYTHIFIDEYQDCGSIQHEIFLMLVKNSIIGVAVGDLNQAIYGFAKRYPHFLISLIENKYFKHLELNTNHRCHSSISNYSLRLLGIIENHELEENRMFKVNVAGHELHIVKAIEKNLDKIKNKYGIKNNSEIAILCRGTGTARRISQFLKLDNKLFIDTPLDKNNTEWGRLFNETIKGYFLYQVEEITLLDFVNKYLNEELEAKKFKKSLELINKLFSTSQLNLADNIFLFVEFAELIHPDLENIESINVLKKILKSDKSLGFFKPPLKNEINIMTLHKSKGLEFQCVFLFDVYKYIQPREGNNVTKEDVLQALNLHYVGISRAIEVCYIMIGTERYREKHDDYYKAVESPFLYKNNLHSFRRNVTW